MSPETIPCDQDSPERGAAPFPSPMCRSTNLCATCVSGLCALCGQPFSLDFRLSPEYSTAAAQPSSFHNLPHSCTTTEESPLCFHNLTNSSPCNRLSYTHLSKHRGYTPLPGATSEPLLEVGILTLAASMAWLRGGKGCHPDHRKGSAFRCVAVRSQTALTNPPAHAYNSTSLMTNRSKEFSLGPPPRWRAAPFMDSEAVRS
jgi:hypothetical protein